MRRNDFERIASWCGLIWFFISINPFFIWFFPRSYCMVFGTLLVMGATFLLDRVDSLVLNKSRLLLVGMIVLVSIFTLLKGEYVSLFIKYVPFIFIVLWRNQVLYNIYELFRKWMIFFAIGGLCISLLSIVNVLHYLPSFDMPSQSSIQEMHGIFNRIYGCFVTNVEIKTTTDIVRACGPLQEPGHFAIFLGIVYYIDMLLQRKRNMWIIFCGIMTFSFNFLFMVLLAECCHAIMNGTYIKLLKFGFVGTIILSIVFFLLPSKIQEQVLYMAYERNLETVVETGMQKGLVGALAERTNDAGEIAYSHFFNSNSNVWFGIEETFDDGKTVLSDYRGIIINKGYIGFLLIVFLMLISVRRKIWILSIGFFMIELLVLLHRSWMLNHSYIFFIVFCGIATFYHYETQKLKYEVCDRK